MPSVARAAAAAFCLVLGGMLVAPTAKAADWALNGRYLATSNGDWAQTNEVYHDEATVQSTWTITMSCTNVLTCSGTVSSDAGWTAPITTSNMEYVVKRDIPNWEPCGDGRTVTGHQLFRFFPVADGVLEPGSPVFAGYDKTSGESGGCSRNDKLQIDLPFRLDALG